MSSTEHTLPAHSAGHATGSIETLLGTRLGRYEIIGLLGAGAMGLVFEARDTELDRPVALKLVRPEAMDPETARSCLRREARVMARLSSTNVAAVFDLGVSGEHLYIAMELVRGGTVRELIGQDRPWYEQLRILIAAGRGLAAAHEAGVIHRDFKPDNVLVQIDGSVRVADFGLARETGDRTAPPDDTGPAAMHITGIAGTCGYMAPESFEGIADAATDQFAFAVTAFEVIEGRRPFDDNLRLDVYVQCLREGRLHPWRRPDVPRWLRDAIDRGLAIDPSDRWPSMSELCAALEPIEISKSRVCPSELSRQRGRCVPTETSRTVRLRRAR